MNKDLLRKRIILAVNLLTCSARDGEYGTEKHMKMYEQFKKLLEKLVTEGIGQR